MVRIGIIGVGFMGMIHFLAARKLKSAAKVTAICTRDAKKLKGDWRSIRGNFGPPGAKMDLAGVKGYREIPELLADPDIDMVDICLPTHLHVETARMALEAGKHVLLEKPISLDVADGKALISAAKKAGRKLLIAHVLPFFPDWAFALQTVKSGEYGRLQAAHFRRLICKPDWSGDVADFSKSGGPAIDLHIHDTHFIQLLCGAPTVVSARGIEENRHVAHMETAYTFNSASPVVTCSSGALAQPGLAFTAGFEMYLERATLLLDGSTLGGKWVASKPLTMIVDKKVIQPKLKASGDPIDCFAEEIRAAVENVAHDTPAPALSAEGALTALALCHREIQSVKSGKPVKV